MKEVAAFDIDNTMIIHDCNLSLAHELCCQTIRFEDPYDGKVSTFVVNEKHVKLLHDYQARGFQIVLWSNNGESWAKAVGTALKLQDVTYMTKPCKIVDDQHPEDFLPKRIYLNGKYQQFCLDNNRPVSYSNK